jgi:hypothetical protein
LPSQNKCQNIYTKGQFNCPKHLHQTPFETFKIQETMFLNMLMNVKTLKTSASSGHKIKHAGHQDREADKAVRMTRQSG